MMLAIKPTSTTLTVFIVLWVNLYKDFPSNLIAEAGLGIVIDRERFAMHSRAWLAQL